MSNDIAIKIENISKKYKLYDSPQDRLKEALHPFRKQYHKEFYALKDINLEIKKGESLGIIGKNGAGKSTLLKIITGVLTPTSGTLSVNGKVSALLELGTGFNPEYTGIENVYFKSALMGYSRKEIDEIIDEIIEFADIGDFINQPVKTYSSGMFVRLAFAVAVNIKPEILILDEVMSVGDMFFQAKSIYKMASMIKKQTITSIFVSHDLYTINANCRNTLWLEKGNIIGFGETSKITRLYSQSLVGSIIDNSRHKKNIEEVDYNIQNWEPSQLFEKNCTFNRVGNGKSEFYNFTMMNLEMEELNEYMYNEKVILQFGIKIKEDLPLLSIGYSIINKDGLYVLGTNSLLENKFIIEPKAGEKYIFQYITRLPLAPGMYNIMISQSFPLDIIKAVVDVCDRIPCAFQFTIIKRNGPPIPCLTKCENDIKIQKCI